MSVSRITVSFGIVGLSLSAIGVVSVKAFPLKGLVAAPASAIEQVQSAPSKRPIRVGSQVMKSKLIHHVEPAFPEGGREGLLFLQVSIGTEGHVQNVKVLRSPPPSWRRLRWTLRWTQ